MEKKICSKCRVEKSLDSFYHRKLGKLKRHSECKVCFNKKRKEYRDKNKVSIYDTIKKWKALNPERVIDMARKNTKRWRADNLETSREKWREWKNKDIEKYLYRRRTLYKERKGDVKVKLNNSTRCSIYASLKGNKSGRHWETLVEYTVDQLKVHLEKQFLPGMTWGNYGKHGWHIDHVIPKSVFNFKTPEDIDFKKCWALENLQPLWALDNMKKSDKLLRNFQPSFSFTGDKA